MSGRKMIVFGGNGFVGSQVTKAAVEAGWTTIVACRSGTPTETLEPWVHKAQYVSIDALSRSQVFECLDDHPDTTAIVSCIGALTTDPMMGRRLNGDATINMAAALFERKGIRKLVFVSAEEIYPASRFPLKGYYQGKKAAERAMLENIPDRSVVLRPGMIYGSRKVPQYHVSLPLGILGAPLRMLFTPLQSILPISLLTPPISVEEVAKACVFACQDPTVHGVFNHKGIELLAKGTSSS